MKAGESERHVTTLLKAHLVDQLAAAGWEDTATDFRVRRPRSIGYAAMGANAVSKAGSFHIFGFGNYGDNASTVSVGQAKFTAIPP